MLRLVFKRHNHHSKTLLNRTLQSLNPSLSNRIMKRTIM